MTVFFHEIKRGKKALIIWTAAIAAMLAVNVLLFPLMKATMNDFAKMTESLGEYSSLLSSEGLGLGSMTGYFAAECGSTLGLGGALFAAITAVSVLAKEELERTAEFLLTQPVSRSRVVFEKLLSALFKITVLNLVVIIAMVLCFLIIGEEVDAVAISLTFLSYYLLQVVTASVCFFISALLKGNGIGIGLGVALFFYFLDIIANISDKVKFLKYATPFSFANGSEIVNAESIEIKYLIPWLVISAGCVVFAFIRYNKKDIAA